MIDKIIIFSVQNKLIILLFTIAIIVAGIYALSNLSIGSVPDITSNQVQVITVARNLATEEVEQYITYPVELSMANLPGVKEIRSISKFGLSFVTVVFEDKMGTYLPRQLIAEKLKYAQSQIPEGMGTPEMAPISTGLGEILQYTLELEEGYDSLYSIMDLREIQDWIIRRQLAGTKGVIEVNTWGGFLKQYEVALSPDRLRNMNISLLEVFNALKTNNQNTGGAYIEKNRTSYFIRGEGMITSLDDIRQTVVTNRNNIPMTIENIGVVSEGYATRFGAITGNGQGEKVMGQVMMLKGENPYAVINRVNARMEEIQKSLPEGVIINRFLDRSVLIDKTTGTVQENLILGALFVIFVLVLLIGNFRSGLLVASVIPLSMLFGLVLMYVFGVDANLLSLGAVDFGILIDGAVIIVEFVVYRITIKKKELLHLSGAEYREAVDNLTIDSSRRMMNAAIFGQIIILIVFIPILAFKGVEGRMFRPMALTFIFILLGAMVMCLTYVPVMASLFIRPPKHDRKTLADRLLGIAHNLYDPVIELAMRYRRVVLSLAVILLASAVFLFSKLGGEFLPTLDEGDYVIQPVFKPGTSLDQTVRMTTRIESILLDKFPDEVEQVISRIGAAEVPTDPMSIEMSDIIVKLKPLEDWKRAESKEVLAILMTNELDVIPGVEYQFTQPIEMRFNEMLTGVQSDIAIKIYGDDLDELYRLGLQVDQLIKDVNGISDSKVEQIVGLPQLTVRYNRAKMASYGVSIEEVNTMIQMGFSGASPGIIFEGERRFDLAIRLQRDQVTVETVRNLAVKLPDGGQVPLSQLADITYDAGPAQISRDDTRRRIVIGINVREKDIESVVNDIQPILEDRLNLPAGYSITYGGQFENLRKARARLVQVVPVALLLIFIMLYFTFNSLKESLLIFLSIPLGVIGGVVALWIRGMPFSISAGIGFIALSGIAVLNGIVLISYFRDLEKEGVRDLKTLILTGTRDRLRPVLLTASTDVLGFIPMALSTSSGAEVQQPLATVVIGGLVTAFFLTLIVLPVLYFEVKKRNWNPKALLWLILPAGLVSFPLQAQEKTITLDDAYEIAKNHNANIQAAELEVSRQELLVKTGWNLDKTQLFYGTDKDNPDLPSDGIERFGVQQNLQSPGVYIQQRKRLLAQVDAARSMLEIQKRNLRKQVSKAYYNLVYQHKRSERYQYLDSLYANFAFAANRRFDLGESNKLEMILAQGGYDKIRAQATQTKHDIEMAYYELKRLLQVNDSIAVFSDSFERIHVDTQQAQNAGMIYFDLQVQVNEYARKSIRNQFWPDINVQYSWLAIDGQPGFIGYQLGLNIPLWVNTIKGQEQAAEIEVIQATQELRNFSVGYEMGLKKLSSQLNKIDSYLDYFEQNGLPMAREVVDTAEKSYGSGEIGYLELVRSLEYATQIHLDYLENLNEYNQVVFELNYFTNFD